MNLIPECALLGFLQRAGLRLSERAGVLHAGPQEALTLPIRETLKQNRDEILSCLKGRRPAFVCELLGLFPGATVELHAPALDCAQREICV